MYHDERLINHVPHSIPQRNGTLTEVSTMHTGLGEGGMHKFGYLDRLNGLDRLPHWREKACTSINASEGSFFPPREITKADMVYVYDKDLCRILPLKYVEPVVKDGEWGCAPEKAFN